MIRGVVKKKKLILSPYKFKSSLLEEQSSFVSGALENKKSLEQLHEEANQLHRDIIEARDSAATVHNEFLTELEAKLRLVDELIADAEIIKEGPQGERGDKGDTPIAGVDFEIPKDGLNAKEIDPQVIIKGVLALMPPPKEVKAPVVDHKKIATMAAKMIVIPTPKDPIVPSIEDITQNVIEWFKKNLTVEHIPGLKNEIASYRNQLAGKVYGKDTLIRGGGDRVKAGSNITVTDNSDGTRTIAAQAGFTLLSPTGTVDGSNATFVFTRAPSIIVVDGGRSMQKTSSDGTVNWTGTLTVVLTIAPNFDIYGF